MKKVKSIFSFFLSVLFIFMLLPLSVSAETIASGTCSINLTWTLDDEGTLTISGSGRMISYSTAPWNDSKDLITSVVIEDGVINISSNAFCGYTNLKNVSIGSDVESIGSNVFKECDSLTSITIPENVTSICEYAFANCDNLSSVEMLYGVTSIENYAFSGCTNLKNINLPDSVTTIGFGVFESCKNLSSIEIPNSVTTIELGAFVYCSGLTSVKIPDSITSIEQSVFYSCTGLTSIEIPNSVTNIGWSAFYNCTSLTDIYYGGTMEEWSAISINSGNTCLTNATVHFLEDTPSEELTWILDDEGTLTISGNGDMDDYTVDSAPWSSKQDLITNVIIEDGVTSIGNYSFTGYSNLTNVEIPNSVESIGECAFYYCIGLTSVKIPSGVTDIGAENFVACINLLEIEVDTDNDYYCSIDGVLFDKAVTKLACYPAGREEVSYSIPSGVTSIEIGAFDSGTSLTSIYIPDSVTNIGDYAFFDCLNLNDVYYYGTKEEWTTISIGLDNNLLTDATIHFIRNISTDTAVIMADISHDTVFTCNGEEIGIDDVIISASDIVDGNMLLELTDAEYDSYSSYDISLADADGNEVTIESGTITIILPFPDGIDSTNYEKYTFTLYHFLDNESYETLDCTVTTDGVTFTTDSFSPFIFTALDISEPEPETSDVFVFKINDNNVLYANQNMKFAVDEPAQLVGGKTLVPLRAISSAVGIDDLIFDSETFEITFTGYDGYTIEMTVGSTVCTLTKDGVSMDITITAPVLIDGITMLPLRDATALVGGTVKFDDLGTTGTGYVVVSGGTFEDADVAGYIDAYEAI